MVLDISIPDLCPLSYFYSLIDLQSDESEKTISVDGLGGG